MRRLQTARQTLGRQTGRRWANLSGCGYGSPVWRSSSNPGEFSITFCIVSVKSSSYSPRCNRKPIKSVSGTLCGKCVLTQLVTYNLSHLGSYKGVFMTPLSIRESVLRHENFRLLRNNICFFVFWSRWWWMNHRSLGTSITGFSFRW